MFTNTHSILFSTLQYTLQWLEMRLYDTKHSKTAPFLIITSPTINPPVKSTFSMHCKHVTKRISNIYQTIK